MAPARNAKILQSTSFLGVSLLARRAQRAYSSKHKYRTWPGKEKKSGVWASHTPRWQARRLAGLPPGEWLTQWCGQFAVADIIGWLGWVPPLYQRRSPPNSDKFLDILTLRNCAFPSISRIPTGKKMRCLDK